jgi:hypothetical protein
MTDFTQSRLKELLIYDETTGLFTWIKNSGRKKLVGTTAGSANDAGYVYIGIDGRVYLAHRLAWLYMMGLWPDPEIDHKDTNPTNNRWKNIRESTSRANKENRRKPINESGYLGVYPCNDRFKACIKHDRRQIHLGMFDTPELAHAAYLTAKRKIHEGCTI